MQCLNSIYILHSITQMFWLSFKATASGVTWHCAPQVPFELGAGDGHSWGRRENLKIEIVQEQRRQRGPTDFYSIIGFEPSSKFEP